MVRDSFVFCNAKVVFLFEICKFFVAITAFFVCWQVFLGLWRGLYESFDSIDNGSYITYESPMNH